ncbi:hypothetical protein [Flavobacterium sp. UBA7680]|uniref:hypothetical protein n=1 Tax=Flavobacterium sp. UBA7680 TaxID=1946559 RepID=UPI0025BF321D|nr:hypothetical protein [Flavobacterium sp. UBA7680]
MTKTERRIILLRKLSNFIVSNDTFQNQEDIRSISINALGLTVQNFIFSLTLSKKLLDLNYCKEEISSNVRKVHLATFNYNFNGFVRDAFFNSFFLNVENHLRQIAINYERTRGDINKTAILETFKNLLIQNKTTLFTNLTNDDLSLFTFYCYLRNTIHSLGFQTRGDSTLVLHDRSSLFNKKRVEIKLISSTNSVSFEDMILLQEQIFKLLIKMNSFIPNEDTINHRLANSFNS